MNPTLLYQQVRTLAHEKRGLHKAETAALDIPFIQRIYKAEGITIDRRALKGNRLLRHISAMTVTVRYCSRQVCLASQRSFR